MKFPEVELRNVMQGKRKLFPINGYYAVVNTEDESTYAIVSDRYKLVPHQEVIDVMDRLCDTVPGLKGAKVNKEIKLANNSGRMKVKYSFPDLAYEIIKGDAINMTLEAFASFDTTLAQRLYLGFWRLICSNGAKIGKTIAEYKRKHTNGLSLDSAAHMIETGLLNFPEAVIGLQNLTTRDAFLQEINLFEAMPLQKEEKALVENEIKRIGVVKHWDNEDIKNRNVQINSWELYNIYTAVATHEVKDLVRQQKIIDSVAEGFKYGKYKGN